MTFTGVTAVVGGVLFGALLASMGAPGGKACVRVQGLTVPLLILTCAVTFVTAMSAFVQLGHLSWASLPVPM